MFAVLLLQSCFSSPPKIRKPLDSQMKTKRLCMCYLIWQAGSYQPKCFLISAFTLSKSLQVKVGISRLISSMFLSHHLNLSSNSISSSSKRFWIALAGFPTTFVYSNLRYNYGADYCRYRSAVWQSNHWADRSHFVGWMCFCHVPDPICFAGYSCFVWQSYSQKN